MLAAVDLLEKYKTLKKLLPSSEYKNYLLFVSMLVGPPVI